MKFESTAAVFYHTALGMSINLPGEVISYRESWHKQKALSPLG